MAALQLAVGCLVNRYISLIMKVECHRLSERQLQRINQHIAQPISNQQSAAPGTLIAPLTPPVISLTLLPLISHCSPGFASIFFSESFLYCLHPPSLSSYSLYPFILQSLLLVLKYSVSLSHYLSMSLFLSTSTYTVIYLSFPLCVIHIPLHQSLLTL